MKVHIKAQKVHVLHWFELHWVAIEVWVSEGLDGEVGEECPVEGDEAVVHVAVVDKVDLGVVRQGVVELIP